MAKTVPNVPLWVSPDRAKRARLALEASTSLMEWAVVQAESLPEPQHDHLQMVADFVAEINVSILHAYERLVKEQGKGMALKPVNDEPESSK